MKLRKAQIDFNEELIIFNIENKIIQTKLKKQKMDLQCYKYKLYKNHIDLNCYEDDEEINYEELQVKNIARIFFRSLIQNIVLIVVKISNGNR